MKRQAEGSRRAPPAARPVVGSPWLSVRSVGAVQSGRRLGDAEHRASSVRAVVIAPETMSAAWRALPRVPSRAWAPSPSRSGDAAAERSDRLEHPDGRGRGHANTVRRPVGATAPMPDEFATPTVLVVSRSERPHDATERQHAGCGQIAASIRSTHDTMVADPDDTPRKGEKASVRSRPAQGDGRGSGPSCDAVARVGMRNVKRVSAAVEAASICPPWARAISDAMNNPRPRPC